MLLLTLELVDNYARYMYRVHEHSTAKRYVWEVKNAVSFLTERFKGTPPPVEAIGKEHLLAYLMGTAEHLEAPARATWNNQLRPLRSFWNYLREAELTDENPAEEIKTAKIRSGRRLPITFAEFLDLVEAIERSSPHYRLRNLAMVITLFFCGLRVSELTRLRISSIDWANSVFINLRVKGGKYVDVHFTKTVGMVLRACIEDRPRFRPKPDDDSCFLSDRSRQISIRQFQGILSALGQEANIHRPVSPHVVRHASATELARGGLNLFGLKEFLNHETIVATQRYVHLTDEIIAATDELDQRFTTSLAERSERRREKVGLALSLIPDFA